MWEERRRNGEALPPLDCLLISFLPPKCSHPSSSSSSCRHLLHAAAPPLPLPPFPPPSPKQRPRAAFLHRGVRSGEKIKAGIMTNGGAGSNGRGRGAGGSSHSPSSPPLSLIAARKLAKEKAPPFLFPASFSPPFYFLPLLFFVSAFVRLPRGLRREGGRGRKKKEVPSPTSSSPGRPPRTHFLLSVVVELCRRTVTSAHQRGSTVPGRVLRGRSHAIS